MPTAWIARGGHSAQGEGSGWPLVDTAENVLAPVMTEPQIVDETALVLGYAGVYSTFCHPTKRAVAKYGLPSRDILVELGRRGITGRTVGSSR